VVVKGIPIYKGPISKTYLDKKLKEGLITEEEYLQRYKQIPAGALEK
jgi:hypothetical protein